MPKRGSQSTSSLKWYVRPIDTRRSGSDSASVPSITSTAVHRKVVCDWRGMKSTATAPTRGSHTIQLRR